MIPVLKRRGLAIAVFGVLLLTLAACGGPPPISSWPGFVVKDNIAYLASAEQVLALDVSPDIADNKRLLSGWPIKPYNDATIGYYGQPALSEDGTRLYVTTDSLTGNSGSLVAIDNVEPETRAAITPAWTYPMTSTDVNPGHVYGGVVLHDGVLYMAGGLGMVFAIDADTGAQRWPAPFDTGSNIRIWSLPAVTDTLVIVASQDHHLYAIDKETGTLRWKYPADGDAEIGTLAGSPATYGDTVYVGSFDGYLYAVDLNGRLKWKFQAQGRIWDPPAESNGLLYFGDLSGHVYALDAATGQPAGWPQAAKVDGGVRATPLVHDDVIYVGTDRALVYALDRANGRPIWQSPFKGRDGEIMAVTPAVSGDTLVVLPTLTGADPVRLYGVARDTGALLWRYPPAAQ